MSDIDRVFNRPPHVVMQAIEKLLRANIDSTKSLYSLCKEYRLLDSQEVLDWQDELNAISIKYE